ncbi:haloalkane dehalogenase [Terrarubrum flagellatum]|uniref:haloalkane dehalogenase n=1 Tax=Terrirubrum flagellatum TaxID=2895980 RepID=UPI0031455D33
MNAHEINLSSRAILGSTMAWREAGEKDAPVALFLHGNPASSYIWRNIIPHVAGVAHCIAPDLIGFGASAKPDIDYRFVDHVRYLDAFIEEMGVSSAYLVGQDWGSALAFHLAARRPDFVRGLAFMEFIWPTPTWDDFHQAPVAREMFQQFRTPGLGEELIMDGNAFIERILPRTTARKLSDEELEAYRAPFRTRESRKPVWRFPNELPIAGQPADVWALMTEAHRALARSTYPKLLFAVSPGALVSPDFAKGFAAALTNCRLVQLGAGAHNLQEDHPQAIGTHVARWIEAAERGAPATLAA